MNLCLGHAGFSLQVFNHVEMAWVPWQCVYFSVMPHLTDSSCLLPTRTSRPSTQINATRQVRLALQTPHMSSASPHNHKCCRFRFTPMDSLRKLHHSLRYRCHVLVTYDWLRQTESAGILALSSLILVEILEN